MPTQTYYANVVFGANISNYFVLTANSIQDAAGLAVQYYDQNTVVSLANGDTRRYGTLAKDRNAIGSNGYAAIVYVKDPSSPAGLANAWQMTVQTSALTVPIAATYSANGIGAGYSTFGA